MLVFGAGLTIGGVIYIKGGFMKSGDCYNPYMVFQGCIIPNCLLKRKDLTLSAKICFGRLAQYAGDDGYCYPSLKQLSEELAVSETTVENAIKDLISAGLIIKETPTGVQKLMHFRNIYKFTWSESFLEQPKTIVPIPQNLGCEYPNGWGIKKENHNNNKNSFVEKPKNEDFENFWKNYPRKDGKAQALKAWNKAGKSLPEISFILQKIDEMLSQYRIKHPSGTQFIPMASTWINNKRWEDEYDDDDDRNNPLLSKY